MRVLRLIAATILCVATQAARADDAEPAWRASALAMVPAGYVTGTAYRTEGSTGTLAVYPASSNDPKTPASVFAARQALVVTLTPDATRAVSAELKPRSAPDPDNDDTDFAKLHADLAARRATLPEGPSRVISAPGPSTRILMASTCAPSPRRKRACSARCRRPTG